MRKIAFFTALILCAVAVAQNKLDTVGKVLDFKSSEIIPAMVEFTENIGDFGTLEVETAGTVGDIVLVNATAEQLRRIADLPNVRRVQLSTELHLLNGGADATVRVAAENASRVSPEPVPTARLADTFRHLLKK